MCSYNKVNGTYASEHRWLLTEVLRDEWGFDGLVVSDWGAVHDRVAALRAGLDLEMPPDLGAQRRRRRRRGARRALCRGGARRPRSAGCCELVERAQPAPRPRMSDATPTPTTPWLARGAPRSAPCC